MQSRFLFLFLFSLVVVFSIKIYVCFHVSHTFDIAFLFLSKNWCGHFSLFKTELLLNTLKL
jgi:hypothetical protein